MTSTSSSFFSRLLPVTAGIAGATVLAMTLSGCSAASGEAAANTVTIIVHDSFPAKDFEVAASAATGYEVKVISAGDGGELTNQLVLTRGAPIADLFFGVDNTFASRIVDYDLVDPYLPANLPERATEYLYDQQGSLLPVDMGATCVNIDPAWFVENRIPEPETYEDLADPRYEGLTVLLDPTGSSTGASFLIGTIAEYGEDGFADYWSRLAANNPRLEYAWTAAYNEQFTQGGGNGTYPIVVSYDSSPAWTVTEDGTSSTTKALLETCSSQIEYAGLLKEAANPEGARAVMDYLFSSEFQNTVAEQMYMYPIDTAASIPAEWANFAPQSTSPNDLPSARIGAEREGWLKTWANATGW